MPESTWSVEELFDRYADMAYRRCHSLLRDSDQARDATQDVFVQVIRALPRFRGDSSPLTWIYRIATTHCLKLLRKRARIAAGVAPPELAAEPHERTLLSRGALAELVDALDALSQEILVYAFVDEMTQEEIAEVVKRSRKTVGKRLAIIRERVRAMEDRAA